MRQKLYIFLGLFFLVILLVGLNTASYVQREKLPDDESNPNRSTFNSGATGTRAFYELLVETGQKPLRWTEPPIELLNENRGTPTTFVIIGSLRQEFTEEDAEHLLRWVSGGGKLVVIDRQPPEKLVTAIPNWKFSFQTSSTPFFGVDAYNQPEMTSGTKAAKPIQPSIFNQSITAVQPSRFAAGINFERLDNAPLNAPKEKAFIESSSFPTPGRSEPPQNKTSSKNLPSSTPVVNEKDATEPLDNQHLTSSDRNGFQKDATVSVSAPFIHLANDKKNILVDVPYGAGQIVFLTDPYIVANNGISIADNAQLAINLVAFREGIIAFDEYHQGYGSNQNRLLAFFAGTPVIPIFLQLALLVGLVFFSQSRRFARPVPEPESNRLSRLEYILAMAELQHHTKCYDLAIENIYTDFRRRVSNLVGADSFKTRRKDLAILIAERLPEETQDSLEFFMNRCEDIIHGAPTNKKEVLRLIERIREIEQKLGLLRKNQIR
jgi:hypothetical protein